MKDIKKNLKVIDYVMLLAMAILICVGLYCVRQAYMSNEDQDSIMLKQLLGVAIGFLLILVIMFIDYHIICNLSFILYIAIVFTLVFTLLFSSNLNGVKRWIVLFGIPFQPSEMTKLVLILYLAYLCSYFKNKLDKLYVLFILAAVAALPTILILLEPHLSSGISILFLFCVIIYSSGISYKVIGKTLAFILPVVLSLFILITQFNVKIPFIESYQIGRVLSFLSTDESEDLEGNYQQNQSVNAIESGGLHGKLVSGATSDRSYSSIYAKESDFIFAIVGEEFGFIGCFVIVLLYFLLIIKCLIVSRHAPDDSGKLICIGVSSYIMFQFFVNIGVATNLLPNTGLPLPFISNGLTSLICSMAAIGLVLNVDLRIKLRNRSLHTLK